MLFRLVLLVCCLGMLQLQFAQCPGEINFDVSGTRCIGSEITFVNNSTGNGITDYIWYFEQPLNGPQQSTGSSVQDVTFTYHTAGNYTVQLLRKCGANFETREVSLSISNNPDKPIITPSSASECGEIPVSFSIQNQVVGNSYNWDFGDPASGDDNTVEGVNVNHAFTSTGQNSNYQVTVTTENSAGCQATSDIVNVNNASTPNINIIDSDPLFNTGGNFTRCLIDGNSTDSVYTFIFQNQSVSDDPNTVYTFDFGDGSPTEQYAQGEEFTHEYESFGVHEVLVTARNTNTGCTSTEVVDIINEKFPSASLSIPPSQVNICDSTLVTVNNNSQNATSYVWYWGETDSTYTESTDPVSHEFVLSEAQACDVTSALGYQEELKLEARNSCFTHENTSPINIRPKPRASFSADPGMVLCFDPGKTDYDVVFTLESCPERTIAGFPTVFNFEIIDPNDPQNLTITPIQSNEVSHTFTAAGEYPIRLTATNSCGTFTIHDTLYISDPAYAEFGNTENAVVSSECTSLDLSDMTPSSSCGPFILDLINLSSNLLPTDEVNWSVTPVGGVFGSSDAATSESYNDNVAFDIGQSYTLTLAVSNECNTVPSEACAVVNVKDIPSTGQTVLAGFEDSGFELTNGNPNNPSFTQVIEYSKCDVSTLSTLFINGLDDSTETYNWLVTTHSGSTTGYTSPTDSLPGDITFDPGSYTLQVELGNECGDTVSAPVDIQILEPEPTEAGGEIPVSGSQCKDPLYAADTSLISEIVKCSGELFELGNNTSKPGITYSWTSDSGITFDSIQVPNTTVTLTNLNEDGENTCHKVFIEIDNGVCAKLDSVLLVVRPAPVVDIGSADTTVCKNIDALTFDFSPSGGSWTSTTPGVISVTGEIIPTALDAGDYLLTYEYVDPSPNGCTLIKDKNLTIVDTTNVNLVLDPSYCESDIAFQAIANPTGGIWTAEVASAIDSTGMLTTAEIGTGNTSEIYYSFTDVNHCVSKVNTEIQVSAPVIPDPGVTDSICANETGLQLLANTAGGIWIDTTGSFDLSTSGVFTPTGLDSGYYKVYYEINTGTPCVQRSLKDIFVKPLTEVTIQEPIGPFCEQDVPTNISATPEGGIWNAPNNSVNIVGNDTLFSPSLAGENLLGHTLEYSFSNEFGCVSSAQTSVVVQPLPEVNAGNDIIICRNEDPYQLVDFTPTGGGVSTWSIINNSFNSISNSAVYQPDSVLVDTVRFNFSLPSGCNDADTLVITVVEPVQADAGLPDSICISDTVHQLVSGTSTPFDPVLGSQWIGDGVYLGTDSVDLFAVSQLNVPLEYVYQYGTENCITYDTTILKVFALPDISGPTIPASALCEDAQMTEITGYFASTTGVSSFDSTFGSWSGAGVTQIANRYFFDPNEAGATGVPTIIRYTYTDSLTANCSSSYEHLISVEAIPVPNVTIPDLYCVNEELELLNTSSIAFGQLDSSYWKFSLMDSLDEKFVSTSSFTYTQSGDYEIVYTVVSDKGCDSSFSHEIKIIDPPVAQFTINTLPASDCGPVEALISDQSTGYDSTYSWLFGLNEDTVNTYLPNDTSLVYNAGYITDTFYYVTLIVENQCAADTMFDSIRVLPKPNASFGTDKDIGCSPATFEFNNNSLGVIDGEPTFYNFTFSDGSPDVGPITHRVLNGNRVELGPDPRTFVYDGFNDTTYTIRMIAENSCGSDTAYKTITVLPRDVKAFFNQNINEGCTPLEVQYTDFSTNATFVSYDFGDGNSTVGRNTSHIFENNTTDIVEYTVSQMVNNSCSYDTIQQAIRVFPLPKAQFNIESGTYCEQDSLRFVNQSSGHNNSEWIFVNQLDTIRNINSDVFYGFDSGGAQTIKLVVSESLHNCRDTTEKSIEINANPNTVIGYDSITGCEPLLFAESVPFNDPDDRFRWIVPNNDTVSFFNTISYEFEQEGEYSVIVLTQSSTGCVDIDTIIVEVYPTPHASFDIDVPTDLCLFPKLYGLESTSSEDAQHFSWSVDDIEIDTLNTTTVQFDVADTVVILLEVANNYACTDTAIQNLKITPLPVADFVALDTVGCEPFLANYVNLSLYANEYLWSTGDGFVNDRSEFEHLYNDGIYDIQLIATSEDGCVDTISKERYIDVLNKPNADFVYTPEEDPNLYGTVYFTSISEYATFYYWNFGSDWVETDSIDITHRFELYGEKEITLVAQNQNNCTDTITKPVNVPFFGGLYVPNVFMPLSVNPEIGLFKPVGLGLAEYHIQVFDTWGNLLWESYEIDDNTQPAEGWDGTFNNEPLPENSYVWKVEAVFVDGYAWEGMTYKGERKRMVGTVTLVR